MHGKELIAKKKAEFNDILKNNDIHTILYVSKYNENDLLFLRDIVKEEYYDETLIFNFKEFSKYDDNFKLNDTFAKLLEKQSEKIEKPKFEEKKEEPVKEKKSTFRFVLLTIAIILLELGAFAYFVPSIASNLNLEESKLIEIAKMMMIAGGALLVLSIIIMFALGKKKKVVKKDSKKNVDSKDKFDDLFKLDTMSSFDASINEEIDESIYQTQRLDFSDALYGKDIQFNVESVDKKYFILLGLESYINSVKKSGKSVDQKVKEIQRFMIRLHFTFKKNIDKKLIVVWREKVFINNDLSLLIFDKTFTINNGLEKQEMKEYILNVFNKEGYNVSEELSKRMASKFTTLSRVNLFLNDFKEEDYSLQLANKDYEKFVLIYFFKSIDKPSFGKLNDYFSHKNANISIDGLKISKRDFMVYSKQASVLETTEQENRFEKYEAMLKLKNDFITYDLSDDFDLFYEFVKLEQDKTKYCKFLNMGFIDYLINKNEIMLACTIIYSFINCNPDLYAQSFKEFFNGLVKAKKDYTKVVQIVLTVISHANSDKKDPYMYVDNGYYLNNNKILTIELLKLLYSKAESVEALKNNKKLVEKIIKI